MRDDSEQAEEGASSESQAKQQQQHQQQGTETAKIMTEEDRQRQQALREAQQVMDSLASNQLDHFNLLGVVANPRGSQHGGPVHPPPNTPVAMSAVSSSHDGPTSTASSTHSGLSAYLDPYSTFEYTINSMTEQIEALNNVFQDWSTQYLEDYYQDSSADTVPESQLQELPPELTNIDLSTLEGYLHQTGKVAQAFHSNHQHRLQRLRKQLKERIQSEPATFSSSSKPSQGETSHISSTPVSDEAITSETSMVSTDLDDIPGIFFRPDFDLTEPRTFSELLLVKPEEEDASSSKQPQQSQQYSSSKAFLEEPTHDLFQLPPQDYFTGDLDKVEVALLEQVREKSDAFFQETNRFALLKEMVGELLTDVQLIRGLLDGQTRAIQSWQQVPQWDLKRKQLVYMENILEGANEILRCKQSIGGLLSAKDDLGAVEQIQYARRLLAGIEEGDEMEEEEKKKKAKGKEGESKEQFQQDEAGEAAVERLPQHATENEPPIELGRLQALKTVGDQLDQYELLVVKSLTEEVSEIFLEWNTSALASMYAFSNGNTSSSRVSSQQEIQRRALNIIESLHMCHSLSHTTQFYSTRLHDVIRMTVRTTVGEFAIDSSSEQNSGNGSGAPATSVSVSVSSMPLERFIDCLDMLFEQLLALLKSASGVDEFCKAEGLTLEDNSDKAIKERKSKDPNGRPALKENEESLENNRHQTEKVQVPSVQPSHTGIAAILVSAAELSSKSIAELLRLRKEVHSMVSLEEIRQIWDTCMKFIEDVERLSGHKCTALRSMLFVQAKAFVERKHESNMSALAAALDSERWAQCEVSAERQASLHRLCTGRAGVATARRLVRSSNADDGPSTAIKMPDAEVEGIRYKVVWSCLLLVEMIMTNIEAAAHFQNLASNVVGKVAELLRLFNSRSTQLVLGAGAIHSAARLKSINAKHLSLVTQCLGMIIAILPHIRAALMAQLPAKQHTLLNDLDKIKKEFADHNEKVLNKFVSIIGGIVEHGLAKHIGSINFDERAKTFSEESGITCCVFLEGVLTNTRKMHQVLSALLPPEHLQDVFSRIFAFIDQKIPALFVAATDSGSLAGSKPQAQQTGRFSFPVTDAGKKRLLNEVEAVTTSLNELDGVFPWDFSAVSVLAKKLEFEIPDKSSRPPKVDTPSESPSTVVDEPAISTNGDHTVENTNNLQPFHDDQMSPNNESNGITPTNGDRGDGGNGAEVIGRSEGEAQNMLVDYSAEVGDGASSELAESVVKISGTKDSELKQPATES